MDYQKLSLLSVDVFVSLRCIAVLFGDFCGGFDPVEFRRTKSVLWKVYSFFDCSATHQALGFIWAICDVGGCGSALGGGVGCDRHMGLCFQAHLSL